MHINLMHMCELVCDSGFENVGTSGLLDRVLPETESCSHTNAEWIKS